LPVEMPQPRSRPADTPGWVIRGQKESQPPQRT
jgi:hypothetical protein